MHGFNYFLVYSVRLELLSQGEGAASLQSVVSQAVVARMGEETSTLNPILESLQDKVPNLPPCLFDCALFDVMFDGDVDDCAVVAAWAGEACMQDCSALACLRG